MSDPRVYVYTIPSRKAVAAIRDRIRWRTRRSTLHYDLDELLLGLNRFMMMPDRMPERRVCPGQARRRNFGTSQAVVTEWIRQTQAERVRAQAQLRHHAERAEEPVRLSREAIAELVESLGDVVISLGNADPADKAEVYRHLGLQLPYHPDTQTAYPEMNLGVRRWEKVRVRGGGT